MANPLRVLANLPKNPFELDGHFASESVAAERLAQLKAEGVDCKMTRACVCRAKRNWRGEWQKARFEFRVWRR